MFLGYFPTVHRPTGINTYGRIAGNSDHLNGTISSAFTIFDHKFYPLNTAGALEMSMGINNAGHIVGQTGSHTWIWQKSGTIYLSPPKGSDFQAFAINNSDRVAGKDFAAFLYDGTPTVILDTLISPTSGWQLTNAQSINDAGQIIADGFFQNEGYEEACLLTPVR